MDNIGESPPLFVHRQNLQYTEGLSAIKLIRNFVKGRRYLRVHILFPDGSAIGSPVYVCPDTHFLMIPKSDT